MISSSSDLKPAWSAEELLIIRLAFGNRKAKQVGGRTVS